jgi:hypothetical protein
VTEPNGEKVALREAVKRALSRHGGDGRVMADGMFAVRCSCGESMPGESFVDRKQALRTHQVDAVMAEIEAAPPGSEGTPE